MADTANSTAVPNGTLNEKSVPLDDATLQTGEMDPARRASATESFHSAASFKSTVSHHDDAPAYISTNGPAVAGAEKEKEEPAWEPPVGVTQTIVKKPTKESKAPTPPALTSEQEAKYTTVFTSVSGWDSIPATSARNAPMSAIQDHERMWLTRECILRYLRATKWVTANALKRLQATLSWRREYGADTFTADYISPENETGKQLVLGYDKEFRPVLYLNPGNQNTKMSDRQIHHLCYMLDRTIDMMPAGQESACLMISFKSSSSSTTPTYGQARDVLNILQNHSPERLGRALISETPWYVSTFFKLISPIIDPVTREKMKFNEDLKKYIPVEQLWHQRGGDLKFEYDHSIYWPALNDECTKRRQAYRKRWEAAGKRVGEYEAYLRGGSQPSLQQVLDAAGVSTDDKEDADKLAARIARVSIDGSRA